MGEALENVRNFFGNLGNKIKGFFEGLGVGKYSLGYILKERTAVIGMHAKGLSPAEREERIAAMRAAEEMRMAVKADQELANRLKETEQYRQILAGTRGGLFRDKETKAMDALVDQMARYIEGVGEEKDVRGAQVAQMNFMQRFSAEQVLERGMVIAEDVGDME